MRSVPRNIDRKGEVLSQCDICGSMWLRSALKRGKDNLLRCVHDQPGRDERTLSELTAARASVLSQRLGLQSIADGARPDVDSTGQPSSSSGYTGVTRRYTVSEVYDGAVPTYANPGTKNNYPGF
jgi:hypothetical protein